MRRVRESVVVGGPLPGADSLDVATGAVWQHTIIAVA